MSQGKWRYNEQRGILEKEHAVGSRERGYDYGAGFVGLKLKKVTRIRSDETKGRKNSDKKKEIGKTEEGGGCRVKDKVMMSDNYCTEGGRRKVKNQKKNDKTTRSQKPTDNPNNGRSFGGGGAVGY